jgi:RNA polymerase primary sigma factor
MTYHVMREELYKILKQVLTEIEFKIINLYFGLINGKALTIKEIMLELKIIKTEIRDFMQTALNKLRISRIFRRLRSYSNIIDISGKI